NKRKQDTTFDADVNNRVAYKDNYSSVAAVNSMEIDPIEVAAVNSMENDLIEVVNENRQQHGSSSHGSSQRINPPAEGSHMITETSTTKNVNNRVAYKDNYSSVAAVNSMEIDPIEVVNENQQHGSTSHGSSQRINPAAEDNYSLVAAVNSMENDLIEVVNENRQQHGSSSHGSSQRINPPAE
nr:hypothetical protein [Tanacetum cinerariifolium]